MLVPCEFNRENISTASCFSFSSLSVVTESAKKTILMEEITKRLMDIEK